MPPRVQTRANSSNEVPSSSSSASASSSSFTSTSSSSLVDSSQQASFSSSLGQNNGNLSEEENEEENDRKSQESNGASSSIQSSASGTTAIPTDLLVQLLSRLTTPPAVSVSRSETIYPDEPKGTTVRSPDKFSGIDRSKLRPFLSQCRMAFLANPGRFQAEKTKIMFAASYLDSVALAWFEPFLFIDANSSNYPSFLSSFVDFEKELTSLFGDPDAIATAEHKLDQLKMKENYQVTRYITEFRRYQTVVNWDDSALAYCFRKGLPSRILDELSRRDDKPATLAELEQVALKIDLRYWQPQHEKQDFSDRGRSSEYPKHHKNDSGGAKEFQAKNNSNSSKPSRFPSSSKPSSAIGSDRKITSEERQRRITNQLCLYCGEAGHVLDNCPKKSPRTSKSSSSKKQESKSNIRSVEIQAPTVPSDNHRGSIQATFSIVDPSAGKA
jgi:Retrotransposon gag protein